jgi:hypothetical protein
LSMMAPAMVATAILITPSAWAEPPPATRALCGSLSGDDAGMCVATCKQWPAPEPGLMARALGFAGMRAVVVAREAKVDIATAAARLGVADDVPQRATLYADYVGCIPRHGSSSSRPT